jgi:hypothetical protein
MRVHALLFLVRYANRGGKRMKIVKIVRTAMMWKTIGRMTRTKRRICQEVNVKRIRQSKRTRKGEQGKGQV